MCPIDTDARTFVTKFKIKIRTDRRTDGRTSANNKVL